MIELHTSCPLYSDIRLLPPFCVRACVLTGLSLSSRANMMARRHLWDTPASNSTVQKPTGATAVLQQLPSNSDTTERAGRAHYYSSCYSP